MAWDALGGRLQARADADEFSGVVLIRRGSETVFGGAYGPASRRWPDGTVRSYYKDGTTPAPSAFSGITRSPEWMR